MYVKEIVLRVAAILSLTTNCFSEDVKSTRIKPQIHGKYPQKVHDLFQNRYGKHVSHNGVWSAWSSWSECSRTCGGGVMVQTRYCINRPSDNRFIQKPRKRRQYSANKCIGLYKRIHLCNPQECPYGSTDFRQEQCSSYNQKKFKGKSYIWEPFLKDDEECLLNCRPMGMNFYATLNKTVIDGTTCYNPKSLTGKFAPKGSKGICVAGSCQSVDSRGVVGSIDENYSECPACSKGLCKSINGIYTRSNLSPGYSLIAQIPKGACRILVQQMKHSKNFLALKKTNSTFIINGDWKFSTTSHSFEGAGTRFAYIKQDSLSLETITSQGPLENAIEIYLVTYQPNLGIKYGYLLPSDIEKQIPYTPFRQQSKDNRQLAPPSVLSPKYDSNRIDPRSFDRSIASSQQDDPKTNLNKYPHRRRRVGRRFSWKVNGISACSKSCGGGIQTTVVSCVRELTQTPVPDKRCAHLEKPTANPIRCNIQDCSPNWSGYWSSCSVTCGTGSQSYIYQCKQELNTGREVSVDERQCTGRPKPLIKTQSCTRTACDISTNEVPQAPEFRSSKIEGEWLVGEWSSCSVSCGTGHRSRSVSCPQGECRSDDRPSHAEYCTLPSCSLAIEPSLLQAPDISPWLVTEWSKCSEECGTGKQTRFAVCGKHTCDISSKPEAARDCSSEKQCGGQWFTGPWKECSDSCSGQSHQTREVLCVVKLRGQHRITNDMTCSSHLKPSHIQPCTGNCDPFWFTGDWRTCENCPNGIQRREVKCMDINGVPSNRCQESNMPTSKRSCNCLRKDDKDKYRPAQDQPIDQNCLDRIRNCYLAVQARLCQYPYYKSQCCLACSKAPRDQLLQ